MKMQRSLAIYASVMAGLSAILPMSDRIPFVGFIPFLYVIVFGPVIMVGGIGLLFSRRIRDYIPILIVIAVPLLGTAWADHDDILHGLLVALTFIGAAAFAVLLSSENLWLVAARVFVLVSAISSLILLHDWQVSGASRLGSVVGVEGTRIIEPNTVGTLVGFATLIGIAVLTIRKSTGLKSRLDGLVFLSIPLSLVVLLLTQSRGALISFVGALWLMAFLGSPRNRLMAIVSGALVVVSLPFVLSGDVLNRFTDKGIGTIGGRTEIWESGIELLFSDPTTLVWGTGSGGAGSALGDYAPHLGPLLAVSVYSGVEDTLRINSHSSYFEWWLSSGLLGLGIGILVIVWMCYQAYQIDKGQGLAIGIGLISFFLLTSMTLVAYRLPGVSIACGGLTWGYLIYRRSHCESRVSDVRGSPDQGKSGRRTRTKRHRQAFAPSTR